MNLLPARNRRASHSFLWRASEREEMIKQRGGRILYASSLLRPPSFLDHQFLGREEEKVWRLLPDLCARTKGEEEKYAECDV